MRWHIFFVLFSVTLLNITKAAPVSEESQFILYYGPSSSEAFDIENGAQIVNSHNFDNSKKTVIYVHGYIETQQSESVQTVVNAYLQRSADYNIITLDWHNGASGNYFAHSLPYANQVANNVSKVIIDMISTGLNIEKLHLVGHSMGAQIVGQIGREIKRRSGGKFVVKRITALDPAMPGYYGPLHKHISGEDAEFVDIIHTDAWLYGAPVSSGTVDFWPNSGHTLQPGCPKRNYEPLTKNDLCSHWRSWHFWAESVAQKFSQKFNAVHAESWEAFVKGNADRYDSNVVMGNEASPALKGVYYLQTNPQSPYARGQDGAVYNPNLVNHQD